VARLALAGGFLSDLLLLLPNFIGLWL